MPRSRFDRSGSSSLSVFRLILWEERPYKEMLKKHLAEAGKPFVVRSSESFGTDAVDLKNGEFIELFMLPVDLHAMFKLLSSPSVESQLIVSFTLKDLPQMLIRRRQAPIDPTAPHLEFTAVFDKLPSWRPRRGSNRSRLQSLR